MSSSSLVSRVSLPSSILRIQIFPSDSNTTFLPSGDTCAIRSIFTANSSLSRFCLKRTEGWTASSVLTEKGILAIDLLAMLSLLILPLAQNKMF